MELASNSVLMVEWAATNGSCQCLCLQGESHLPLISPGDAPRSASGSDSGSFQITASVLGLGACEILHVSFKSEVSVSYSLLAFQYIRPGGLQCQIFWRFIFSGQDPQAGDPDVELRLLAPWGELLQLWSSYFFVGCLLWGVSLGYTVFLPSYISCCGSFFVSLVVENLFC